MGMLGPVSDDEIRKAADVLARQFGDQAHLECDTILRRIIRRGDKEGQEVWERIKAALPVNSLYGRP